MRSPITSKEMPIAREQRNLTFRKEDFSVAYHYFLCEESEEQFTTDELEQINLQQAYNQYRDRHNLPFPDEIGEIRELYGLSAVKMSEIMGFGVNSYRNYESGEVPSHSNGKMIQLMKDPAKFRDLVLISGALEEDQKLKLIHKLNTMIHKTEDEAWDLSTIHTKWLLNCDLLNDECGYKKPSLEKFSHMVIYFASQIRDLYKTKLNKLMFYADFAHYRRTCYSMSGAKYVAIDLGPVPDKFHSIYEHLAIADAFDLSRDSFPSGGVGERFIERVDNKFNAALFNETEIEILELVKNQFKETTTNDIIKISHREKGWLKHQANKETISYNYGFELTQI